MKKLLLILLFLYSRLSIGQTYVLIPDANFAACLQTIVPTAMSGNSLNITNTLVTISTTIVSVPNQAISDLTGIQYFSSLRHLNCSYNYSITNIPLLANSLQTLNCNSASLTTLPTLPNSLQALYCTGNKISCFPTFPNSITIINLAFNPFDCLPNYVFPAMNSYTSYPLCAAGNTNGCAVVGINEIKNNSNQVFVFPNPSNGQFTIESNSTENLIVKLFDLNGRPLFNQNLDNNKHIDLSRFNVGVYNLVIKIGDNTANKKLVIVQ